MLRAEQEQNSKYREENRVLHDELEHMDQPVEANLGQKDAELAEIESQIKKEQNRLRDLENENKKMKDMPSQVPKNAYPI